VRLTAAEKGEVIRLVEGSDLSARQTLRELQVSRATFYTWYCRYAEQTGRARGPSVRWRGARSARFAVILIPALTVFAVVAHGTPLQHISAITSPPMDLVGRDIGTYRVRSLLGSGGMGQVYLAHDSKLDRPVALKLLAPELASDPDRLRRFLQEARAASSLNHPHILVIHDFGELDRRPFIVAEFVEGETLRERLRRGPLPVRDTLAIAVQIAGALTAAHARGIVHRDIKPENVMVRPDGYVKVLDFGLAKLTRPETARVDSMVTQPGTILGTPRYMSPEQARGAEVDARTDVWSLGVMLYEMITGRPPFDGPTATDIVAAVLRSDPAPLEEYAPHAPKTLGRVVAQALAKEPRQRHASAGDLLAALMELKTTLESGAHREHAQPTAGPARARRPQSIESLAVGAVG
jgi:serine/threonine protein kinase